MAVRSVNSVLVEVFNGRDLEVLDSLDELYPGLGVGREGFEVLICPLRAAHFFDGLRGGCWDRAVMGASPGRCVVDGGCVGEVARDY